MIVQAQVRSSQHQKSTSLVLAALQMSFMWNLYDGWNFFSIPESLLEPLRDPVFHISLRISFNLFHQFPSIIPSLLANQQHQNKLAVKLWNNLEEIIKHVQLPLKSSTSYNYGHFLFIFYCSFYKEHDFMTFMTFHLQLHILFYFFPIVLYIKNMTLWIFICNCIFILYILYIIFLVILVTLSL